MFSRARTSSWAFRAVFHFPEIDVIWMRYTPKPIHWAILIVVLVACIAVCGCTADGPSSTTPETTQVPGTTTVFIQNLAFNPASITIPKGTTVAWVNQDSADHVIINDAQGSIEQGELFTSNSLSKGVSFLYKFDTPGTYPYHCSIHPSMTGTVIVTWFLYSIFFQLYSDNCVGRFFDMLFPVKSRKMLLIHSWIIRRKAGSWYFTE